MQAYGNIFFCFFVNSGSLLFTPLWLYSFTLTLHTNVKISKMYYLLFLQMLHAYYMPITCLLHTTMRFALEYVWDTNKRKKKPCSRSTTISDSL